MITFFATLLAPLQYPLFANTSDNFSLSLEKSLTSSHYATLLTTFITLYRAIPINTHTCKGFWFSLEVIGSAYERSKQSACAVSVKQYIMLSLIHI